VPQFRCSISKIINAPIAYVYNWCTDFRADDPKIIGAPYTRNVIEKTKKRAVWIQHYTRDGVEKEGIRYVTLSPPNSWHMEGVNEEMDRTGDYSLRPLGKDKTKLQIVIRTRYKSIEPEPVSKLKENISADWEKYKAALEKEYASR
jgi:hypothetical protein